MRPGRRWLIGTAAVLVLGATVPAAFAARQGGGVRPILCTRNQLNVRQVDTEGAAGTIHEIWAFTNHTKAECSMHGYPRLQMYRKGGRPLQTTTRDTLPPGPHLITIDQGQSATFSTSYSVVPHGTEPCASSSVLRITPPHAKASLFVPARLTACTGVINISAVTAPGAGTP